MNVRITDHKILEALRPLEVSAYLRSEDWQLAGYLGDAATVWRREERQVLLPREASYGDYARRIAEILETLSETEHRSPLEIIRDLSHAASDVVRVRIASPRASDGNLGLEAGVTLFESAKDLLLSAARAAVAPRAFFRSRLPGPADDYMRNVQLGQTEIGSYVVTLLCPVSPELHTNVPSVEEPFDRRVTRTLADAVQIAATAAREAALRQDMAPFTEAVREGVSANLCNALANIGNYMDEGEVEVHFAWSRTRSRPEVRASRTVISLDAVQVLREAARVLRETYSDDDFELTGPVIRLDSTNPAQGGEVIVYAVVEGTSRKVRVELNESDYDVATKAHSQGLEIRCRGRLEKEGRYFTIRSTRGFRLVEDAV